VNAGQRRAQRQHGANGGPRMKLSEQDLDNIASLTLQHYNESAEDSGKAHALTTSVRTSQHCCSTSRASRRTRYSISAAGRGAISRYSPNSANAIGLEGAARFAAMARAHSGCVVWQQDFLSLDLPERHFDGVSPMPRCFMCRPGVARVLRELHTTLKPGGVLFSSNPRAEMMRLKRRALRRLSRS